MCSTTSSPYSLWEQGRKYTLGELYDSPYTPLDHALIEQVTIGGHTLESFVEALRKENICVTEDAERLMHSESFMLLTAYHSIPLAQMMASGKTIPFDALLPVAIILRKYGSLREVIRLKTPPLVDRFGIARTFLVAGNGPIIQLEPVCGN